MLPQACGFFRRATAALAMGAALAVAGCGEQETPDTRVRAVIAAGEAAAEARDLSGILEHVAPAFRDAQGGGREDGAARGLGQKAFWPGRDGARRTAQRGRLTGCGVLSGSTATALLHECA
jgi:hypothetical protein